MSNGSIVFPISILSIHFNSYREKKREKPHFNGIGLRNAWAESNLFEWNGDWKVCSEFGIRWSCSQTQAQQPYDCIVYEQHWFSLYELNKQHTPNHTKRVYSVFFLCLFMFVSLAWHTLASQRHEPKIVQQISLNVWNGYKDGLNSSELLKWMDWNFWWIFFRNANTKDIFDWSSPICFLFYE